MIGWFSQVQEQIKGVEASFDERLRALEARVDALERAAENLDRAIQALRLRNLSLTPPRRKAKA